MNAESKTDRSQRVLIYAPYGATWSHTVEATVAHALKQRGAEVKVLTCDAQFSQCDMTMPSSGHEPSAQYCKNCMLLTKRTFGGLNLDYEKLGTFVPGGVRDEARAWVDEIADADLLTAEVDGHRIGLWIESTVHSHLVVDELDFSDAETVKVFRSYLFNGYVACKTLTAFLDQWQPDSLMMMGGRFFSHRITFELAKKRGVRVLTWERGFRDNTLGIWEDAHCNSGASLRGTFDRYRDLPLRREQLDEVHAIFEARHKGVDTGYYSFVSGENELTQLAERVGMGGAEADRKLVSFFTSSGFEMTSERNFWGALTQYEVIERAIRHYAARPDVRFVVRVHPNAGPNQTRDVMNIFTRTGAPANVTIIPHDEQLNSYQLVDLSTACVAYASTMTMETVALGKPMLVTGLGYYHGQDFALNLNEPAELEPLLDRVLTEKVGADQLRAVHRFAHYYFNEFSFRMKSVAFNGLHDMVANYGDTAELVEGYDPCLDRWCEALLNDGVSFYQPDASTFAGDSSDEDAFLADRTKALVERDAAFRKALGEAAEDSADFDSLVEQAQQAMTEERLEDVETLVLKVLAIRPELNDLRHCLAGVLRGLGKREDALAHLNTILKSDPANASIEAQIALLHYEGDEFADFASHLEQSLKIDPANAEACELLNTARNQVALLSQALERFKPAEQPVIDSGDVAEQVIDQCVAEETQQLVPESGEDFSRTEMITNFLDLAEVYYNKQEYDVALDHMSRAVDLAPEDTKILHAVANLHFQLEDYTNARRYLSQAATHHPEDLLSHLLLANVHQKLGDDEEFEKSIGRALALDPKHRETRRLAADFSFDGERFEEAIEHIEILLSQNPRDIGKLLMRAVCEFKLGDKPAAKATFERVLELDPKNEIALSNLDTIQSAEAKENEAKEAAKAAARKAADDAARAAEQAAREAAIAREKAAAARSGKVATPPAKPSKPAASAGSVGLPVRWLSPIFNSSGYASEAINFIVPLSERSDLGIFHKNNIYSEKFVDGLDPKERETLFRLRDRFESIKGGIVICHNPANGFERLPGAAYSIGRTMFETDSLPELWIKQCNQMDEIWVPSHFNLETFADAGVERDKIHVIPEAVDETFFDPDKVTPLELRNAAKFNFFAMFEWTERKGWDVLLESYLREFSAKDDVCLFLRTYMLSKADGNPVDIIWEKIHRFGKSLNLGGKIWPRIEIIADQVPMADLPRLYKAVDCLLAPSRCEGWGRPHHEAMMMGLPVIATNWGGSTEFMNEENSYLVDYELETVNNVEAPFWQYRGHKWARASVDHMRELMRQVQSDPDSTKAKGQAAREYMLKHYSRGPVCDIVVNRLREIEQKLQKPIMPATEIRSLTVAPESPGQKNVPLSVALDGTFLDFGSLSGINRVLADALGGESNIQLSCVGKNVIPPELAEDYGMKKTARRLKSEVPVNTQITIRHSWPPNWSQPASGALVVMQPWEYGTLPVDWVSASANVDEFWANSEYERRMFVESGVSPDKVKLVPLGIDPDRFHPDVEPLELATKKTFKFLFVGGTIHRKGPDVLLESYLRTFTADDDVCLVIKDFGGDSVYAGQTFGEKIREAQNLPDAPEILYLTNELSEREMAGLYTACECLAHPYRGEGFGMPVIEAMACGLPVIVTAGGATDDFATSEFAWRVPSRKQALGNSVSGMRLVYDGWLLEPDAKVFCQALRGAFENPEKGRERGRAASAHVRKTWTWKNTSVIAAQRLQNLYHRLKTEAEAAIERRKRTAPPIELPAVGRLGNLKDANELLKSGNLSEAWTATEQAIMERPFHPEGYLLLGGIAVAAGDRDRAKSAAAWLSTQTPKWKPATRFAKSLKSAKGTGSKVELPETKLFEATKNRLSVCLITKNEQRFLPQCLQSIREVADQIVVVDTGSTDDTVEIAKAFGAEVHEFEWTESFSDARNEALSHARCEWVLVVDADEELTEDSIENLRREIAVAGTMAYRIPIVDEGFEEDGSSYVPRLFRNAPGLFYVGRVHEQVFSSIEVRRREWSLENTFGTVTLYHHGYTEEVTNSRDKVNRNLMLLQSAIEEFPNEPNLLMNLGLELVRAGNVIAGIESYQEAFEILSDKPSSEVVPELRETLITQLITNLMKLSDWSGIIRVLGRKLVTRYGMTASMHFIRGLSHMELQNFQDAVADYQAAVAKRDEPVYSPVHKDVRKAGPNHCLAVCFNRLGEKEKAIEHFEKALKDDPESLAARYDYAAILHESGRSVEALQRLHELVGVKPEWGAPWYLGGLIALSNAEFNEFALDWTQEAVRHVPTEYPLQIQRARALLFSGDAPAAWEVLSQTPVVASPAYQAERLVCSLAGDGGVADIGAFDEREVSLEVINLYKDLVARGCGELLHRFNTLVDELQPLVPSAVALLNAAMEEAGGKPVAAGA